MIGREQHELAVPDDDFYASNLGRSHDWLHDFGLGTVKHSLSFIVGDVGSHYYCQRSHHDITKHDRGWFRIHSVNHVR